MYGTTLREEPTPSKKKDSPLSKPHLPYLLVLLLFLGWNHHHSRTASTGLLLLLLLLCLLQLPSSLLSGLLCNLQLNFQILNLIPLILRRQMETFQMCDRPGHQVNSIGR